MRNRGEAAANSLGANCDLCHERRGRNAAIVHILKYADPELLSHHLRDVFPESKYMQEWFMLVWNSAHQLYGHIAREKYMPLWVVYFEAHGTKIIDRAEVIMRHRGRVQPED